MNRRHQQLLISKKTVRGLLAGLALAFLSLSVMAQAEGRIPRAQLDAMFADMRAKTSWNVDGPLLWGYFFYDSSREKLKRAADELQAAGYRVVGTVQAPDGRKIFQLHVERVETHSPESLDKRNQELYALADRLGLASYDGMDVGQVPPPAK